MKRQGTRKVTTGDAATRLAARIAAGLNKRLASAAGMDKVEYQARTLTSGTIARLIDSKQYSDIDRAQREFVKFIQRKGAGRYRRWQDAWRDFERTPYFRRRRWER